MPKWQDHCYLRSHELCSNDLFYARYQNASSVLVMARRLSVCLSHCCIVPKRCKLGSRNLYFGLPQRLYGGEISCPCVRGFLLNEGVKKGYPLKRRYFAIIGSSSVKTVADRKRNVAYHNKHCSQAFLFYQTSITLNDLKPTKLGIFVNFS